MLAGVSVVLVILLAPYLRPWLAQRSHIEAKQAQVEALQRQVDQLQAERNRWNDPAFVKAQARERLNFVMPGELGYVVLNDGTAQRQASAPVQEAVRQAGRMGGRPWYDVLWQSVQLAGRPAVSSRPSDVVVPGATTTPSPAPAR